MHFHVLPDTISISILIGIFTRKEWLDHSFFIGETMDAQTRKLLELAKEVGDGLGFEVDDLELMDGGGRTLLRIIIDKAQGVTIDDCTSFSRDFAALLDVDDPIKARFTLEVSSPGLDRKLKRPEHYMKNTGKLVRVVPREKEAGRNFLLGRLIKADEVSITLEVDGEEVSIPLANVKKARLEPEI